MCLVFFLAELTAEQKKDGYLRQILWMIAHFGVVYLCYHWYMSTFLVLSLIHIYNYCMVNEERLRHLIKMAQFDTNDGKQCKPMTQYARKDYVSMRLLGSFVTGTICYGLLMGMWGLYATEELLAKLNKFDIQGLVMTAVVPYLVFMVIYLGATWVIFNMKYTEGRRKVKKYYNNLKKVNQMYEREERLRTSDHKDWD